MRSPRQESNASGPDSFVHLVKEEWRDAANRTSVTQRTLGVFRTVEVVKHHAEIFVRKLKRLTKPHQTRHTGGTQPSGEEDAGDREVEEDDEEILREFAPFAGSFKKKTELIDGEVWVVEWTFTTTVFVES